VNALAEQARNRARLAGLSEEWQASAAAPYLDAAEAGALYKQALRDKERRELSECAERERQAAAEGQEERITSLERIGTGKVESPAVKKLIADALKEANRG
jgi:hypothetical protein